MHTAQRLFEGVNLDGETVGLITYMRTDSVQLSGEALAACRRLIAPALRRPLPAGEAARLSDQDQERPGGARGDPADRRGPHAAGGRALSRRRPAPPLRADLEAHAWPARWRRAARPGDRRHRVRRPAGRLARHRLDRRLRRLPQALPGRPRRPGATTTRTAACCRRWRRATRCAAARSRPGSISPSRRRATPRRAWCGSWRSWASAGPRPTPASSRCCRTATMSGWREALRARGPRPAGHRLPGRRSSTGTCTGFTAELEDQLDDVAGGSLFWKEVLREFWEPFGEQVDEVKERRVARGDRRAQRAARRRICSRRARTAATRASVPLCGSGQLGLKLGRFGAFVGCSNYPECRFTRRLGERRGRRRRRPSSRSACSASTPTPARRSGSRAAPTAPTSSAARARRPSARSLPPEAGARPARSGDRAASCWHCRARSAGIPRPASRSRPASTATGRTSSTTASCASGRTTTC